METVGKYFQLYCVSSLRYLLFSGVFFVFFYILYNKKYKNAKIQTNNATKKDFYREIVQSLQANFIITFFVILVLFTPLRSHTLIYKNISEHSFFWIPISLVLSLIIHDTYFYWMHRLLHHKKIFRFAHLTHHQSTNPSPFTSYSFHFLEAFAIFIVD